MRSLIASSIAATALLFATPAHADLVATAGNDELRLMNTRCKSAVILEQINPDYHAEFRAGQMTVSGKTMKLCWADTLQGAYFIVFEDGNAHAFPITIFIEQPGV